MGFKLDTFLKYLKDNRIIAHPLEIIETDSGTVINLAVGGSSELSRINDLEFYFGTFINPILKSKQEIVHLIRSGKSIPHKKNAKKEDFVKAKIGLKRSMKELDEKLFVTDITQKSKLARIRKEVEEKSKKEEPYHVPSKRLIFKIVKGIDEGRSFKITTNDFVIGRMTPVSECDFKLHDMSVSKKHAQFEINDKDEVIIKDLNSTNGTYLNGEFVSAGILKVGNKILIGQTEIEIIAD